MAKHLVIASYDGICSHYCGVGTIIRNTISGLERLLTDHQFKVSLAYVAADKNGQVFDQTCLDESRNLVITTGGHLIPLCNGTKGYDEGDMWKSFPEWMAACASLVTALNIILNEADDNIIMLHDTPFLPFAKFKAQLFDKPVRAFYLPHSSGLNHQFGNDEWRNKRIQIENECFSLISEDGNSTVIATGDNFGRHLESDYGLSIPERNFLKNGLYLGQYKTDLQRQVSFAELRDLGIDIPESAKIIFGWGRCSVAKGFKELLLAWKIVSEQLPQHYLVLQVPNNSGEDHYFRELKEGSESIARTIVIDDFDPRIWRSVLRCENTDVVCIPSLMDPNPHTPIEAKLLSRGMKYAIVASIKDGIKETFGDNECIRVDPYDIGGFAKALLAASNLTNGEKQAMALRNAATSGNFDYEMGLRTFLENFNCF